MKLFWKKIVNQTKHKMQQNAEELFCMAYANHFAKNKILIHTHKDWDAFIEKVKELPTEKSQQASQRPDPAEDLKLQAQSLRAAAQ